MTHPQDIEYVNEHWNPLVKLTPDAQRELIPDEDVHQCFLKREDIKDLPPDEQEARWQVHLAKINEFREWLSKLDCIVV